jgi:hypothetical protein
MKKVKLPNKLSKLMRVALRDIMKIKKENKFRIYMGWWMYNSPYTCSVCLAGAVMVKEFNVQDFNFADFSEEEWCKFEALNSVRTGHINTAVKDLYNNKIPKTVLKKLKKVPSEIFVEDYSSDEKGRGDYKKWRKDMWKIVHMLEKVEL